MKMSFMVTVEDWPNDHLTDDQKSKIKGNIRSDLEDATHRIANRNSVVMTIIEK